MFLNISKVKIQKILREKNLFPILMNIFLHMFQNILGEKNSLKKNVPQKMDNFVFKMSNFSIFLGGFWHLWWEGGRWSACSSLGQGPKIIQYKKLAPNVGSLKSN